MIEVAKVVSVNKNIAKVKIMKEESCGTGCASCKGCSVVSPTLVEVTNTIGVQVGQEVKIERSSSAYLQSMGLVFILPLVMLFIGIGIGYWLQDILSLSLPKDLFAIVIGVGFWIISYLLVALVDKKSKLSNKVQFKIVDR